MHCLTSFYFYAKKRRETIKNQLKGFGWVHCQPVPLAWRPPISGSALFAILKNAFLGVLLTAAIQIRTPSSRWNPSNCQPNLSSMQIQNYSADREIASRKTNFLLIVLQAAVRHPAVCGVGFQPAYSTKRVQLQRTCCWGWDLEDVFEWELCSQVPSLEIVILMLIFHWSSCFIPSKALELVFSEPHCPRYARYCPGSTIISFITSFIHFL